MEHTIIPVTADKHTARKATTNDDDGIMIHHQTNRKNGQGKKKIEQNTERRGKTERERDSLFTTFGANRQANVVVLGFSNRSRTGTAATIAAAAAAATTTGTASSPKAPTTAVFAIDGRASARTTDRPLAALLPGLDQDPDLPAVDVDADPALAALRLRQRGDDRLLRGLDVEELEERARLAADDLEVLERPETVGERGREQHVGHGLGDALVV